MFSYDILLFVVQRKWVIKGCSHVTHLNNSLFSLEASWVNISLSCPVTSCSFIVCPLHCPQRLLLTSWGNTWSLLCFKWLTLRFHTPLGVRLPTERSVLHETLETRHSSLLDPGWRDWSTQGDHLSAPTSNSGFTWEGQARFRLVSTLL